MKIPALGRNSADLAGEDHVGLDIADRLRPQDGRARITVNNEPIRSSGLDAARLRWARRSLSGS
jgi:hypothetical protein